jgi:hypothetical protein
MQAALTACAEVGRLPHRHRSGGYVETNTLVVVRTFLNRIEADVARTALEASGIDSMIRSDDCGGLRPHLWMGGVQLLVRADDADTAKAVLESDARP